MHIQNEIVYMCLLFELDSISGSEYYEIYLQQNKIRCLCLKVRYHISSCICITLKHIIVIRCTVLPLNDITHEEHSYISHPTIRFNTRDVKGMLRMLNNVKYTIHDIEVVNHIHLTVRNFAKSRSFTISIILQSFWFKHIFISQSENSLTAISTHLPIVLTVCTAHSNAITVLCAKFQNGESYGERYLPWFWFKMRLA